MFRGIRRALHIRFTQRQGERELDDELAFHIERRAAQLIASGMDAESAHREAARRFGDVGAVRDECIAVDAPEWRRDRMRTLLEETIGDVRFAARSLRRSPWFTAVALTTLVIGIASVTAIFSFVYSFYWRPLPYKDAARIMAVEERRANGQCCYQGVSRAAADRIAATNRSFERVTLFDEGGGDAVLGSEARSVSMLFVDSSFAAMFDLRPQAGRLLSREDIDANAPVVVISDDLWRAAFGGDTAAIGRKLRVGTEDLTIVGILPHGFGYRRKTDALRPLPKPSGGETAREATVILLGKLRPNVTRATGAAEMAVIATQLSHDAGLRIGKTTLGFLPEMLDRRASQGAPFPSLFIGAAVFLLLIACSNVMNLMLVRAAERRGEMAVRSSLGAGRFRLIRQALTESLLIALVAGTLGTLASAVMVKLALVFLPTQGFPGWLQFGLDGRVLAFTLLVTLVVTVAVGVTPARDGTRFDLVRALKIGGDGGVVNTGVARSARRGLAVQLAFSIALFIGAALFVKSYRRLTTIDYGYDAEHMLEVMVFYDESRYPDLASRLRLTGDLTQRLEATPAAARVAVRGYASKLLVGPETARPFAARKIPFDNDYTLIPDGDSTRAANELRLPARLRHFAVSDAYFDALGLRVRRGRTFDRTDVAGAPPVVVISDRLADVFWPRQNPVGHTLRRGAAGPTFTVIGVVPSVRDVQGGRGGFVADARPDVYYSIRQVEAWNPTVVARARGAVPALEASATNALRRLDPQVVSRTDVMGGGSEARMVTRIFGAVIACFAVAGLALAVIGLYGVVAYGIAQRRREIGVRLALGATTDAVVRLIVGQASRFVATGLVAGLALSIATGRFLRLVLFQVSSSDPATYVFACALFAGVALLACYVPARRVSRISPVAALRAE